jgi:hypothetical protein
VEVCIAEASSLLLLGEPEIHAWDLRLLTLLTEELVTLGFHHDVVRKPVPEFYADFEEFILLNLIELHHVDKA